ncbi:CHRD domain-containing protein [Noviherbaspirillum galbum]|uniref:CHRD domain-containing protein n=1 Tax=Noviherbaspirillum galbum TaxID=2709383 RepID=A0A6B3SWF6_9BURK|nr:CHRD domain-containing protein [Noviherbaspirillum galbum]NEX63765.1 CHRD domain-containing protein [Noviherbaspirillum galbum]
MVTIQSLIARARRRALPALVAVMLVACGGGHDDFPEAYTATLIGAQQVPPVASIASGVGLVTVDVDRRGLLASAVINGAAGTSVHVHSGAAGVNGPVTIPLAQDPSGVWIARATLSGEQYAALRNGNFYLDVHTAANPNGELRGQLQLQIPNDQQAQAIFQFRNLVPLIEQQRQQIDDILFGDTEPRSGIGIGIGLGF